MASGSRGGCRSGRTGWGWSARRTSSNGAATRRTRSNTRSAKSGRGGTKSSSSAPSRSVWRRCSGRQSPPARSTTPGRSDGDRWSSARTTIDSSRRRRRRSGRCWKATACPMPLTTPAARTARSWTPAPPGLRAGPPSSGATTPSFSTPATRDRSVRCVNCSTPCTSPSHARTFISTTTPCASRWSGCCRCKRRCSSSAASSASATSCSPPRSCIAAPKTGGASCCSAGTGGSRRE